MNSSTENWVKSSFSENQKNKDNEFSTTKFLTFPCPDNLLTKQAEQLVTLPIVNLATSPRLFVNARDRFVGTKAHA